MLQRIHFEPMINFSRNIISLLRVRQWYKNFLLFIGIIFSLNLFIFSLWISVILAFISFCLLSSSAYIVNDAVDFTKDRIHPVKNKRPIPSGKISRKLGIVISIFLMIVGLITAFNINLQFFVISIIFLIFTNSYSIYFKQFAIIDAIIIGINFVIRAIAGCIAINVLISPWIILCVLLLALLLVFGKRRQELIILQHEANNHRGSLQDYSIETLDTMMSIIICTLLISYSLYAYFTVYHLMMITIPIIIYILLRYTSLVHSKNIGGEPELILKDKGILTAILIWAVISIVVLYYLPEITGNWLGFT